MADSVADTWEELEDSGELDRKLDKLVLQSSEATSVSDGDSVPLSNAVNNTVIPCLLEDCPGRTAYQPTVRILKRDPAAVTTNHVVAPNKPTPRTLQEREAAYAEARLRILGAAASNDDDTDETPADDECSEARAEEVRQKFISDVRLLASTAKDVNKMNVVRDPRGPDGTKGFNVKR